MKTFGKKLAVFIAIAIVIPLYPQLVLLPKYKQINLALTQEFGKIAVLPNSEVVTPVSATMVGKTGVGCSYATSLSDSDIRNYYDNELKRNGWNYYKEIPLADNGRGYGGMEFYYRKGDYVAVLDLVGNDPNSKANFVLTLNFGYTS